jgi:bacterioferritin
MKGDRKVIEFLNTVLCNELTAINQYVVHARMLDHWGVVKLGKYEYKESIEEMQHADALIKRILFLDGVPNLQKLNKLLVGETVEEILKCDLKLEEKAIADLRAGIQHCEAVRDFPTRDLLAKILSDEEHHVDFVETQFELIERIGLQNYIQLNSAAAGDEGEPG